MRDARFLTSAVAFAFSCALSVPAHTQTFDDIHRCDKHAAHPDDPNRWAEGRYDNKIIPGPARKYCSDAVKAYPDSVRFHFQHGRALWAAKQYKAAVKAFLRAEEKKYGPAYAYLGDAYFHGRGGVKKDEDLAIKLYKMAAEAGFTPAETVLEQIADLKKGTSQAAPQGGHASAQPIAGFSTPARGQVRPSGSGSKAPNGPQGSSQATASNLHPAIKNAIQGQNRSAPSADSNFDPRPFSRGRRLLRIYNGDFERLRKGDPTFAIMYFVAMNDHFSKGYNFHSESCSAYFDPDLKSNVMGRVINNSMGSRSQTNKAGIAILGAIADMAKRGPAPLMNRVNRIEAEKSAAKKDGVILSRMPGGCQNPKFKRLYINMTRFVRGKDPEYASGWPGLRIACKKHALKQGGGRRSRAICHCLVKEIKASKIPEEKAEWLRANYDHGKNLASLIQGNKGLRKKLGACLLR